jgi:hypothetical protein
VFSAGSLTSPLFSQVEHRRMAERLKASYPGYPVQEYYGDFGDFTQNKPKEWGDLCGADHHVCRLADYPGGDLNAAAPSLQRLGATTRLDRFVDHYAQPPGDAHQPVPSFDVTGALQTCPSNATAAYPADEPGPRFTAPSFAALAPDHLRLQATGTFTTQNSAQPNPHGADAEPISNFAFNGARCPVERTPAGPGAAVYDFAPLHAPAITIGQSRVTVPYQATGSDLQLDARLYLVLADGSSQVLVDRGETRLEALTGTATFDLQGTGWELPAGTRLRLELTQDDAPYLKASTAPSSLTLAGASIDLPVRPSGGAGGSLTPRPPGTRGCVRRRRRVVLRLRAPHHQRVRSAQVKVGGRLVPVRRRGRGVIAIVDLRGRSAGPVRIEIVIRTRRGAVIRSTRTLRVC